MLRLSRASLLLPALVLAVGCQPGGTEADAESGTDEPVQDPGSSCTPPGCGEDTGGSDDDTGGSDDETTTPCEPPATWPESWCESSEDCCPWTGLRGNPDFAMRCVHRYPHPVCIDTYLPGCDDLHHNNDQPCDADAQCCFYVGIQQVCHPALRECHEPCVLQPGDKDEYSSPKSAPRPTERCCGGYSFYGTCAPNSCLANGDRLQDDSMGYGKGLGECQPGRSHFNAICCSRWCESDADDQAYCADPPCGAPGQTCLENPECCSGVCDAGTCKGRPDREPCTASAQCASNRCEEDYPLRSARCMTPPCEENPFRCVPCVAPPCGPRVCGDVGCGRSCGECAADERCVRNTCCRPDCQGKQCGDDGCGSPCPGQCGPDQVCYKDACCTPSCEGRCDDDDGCGHMCPGCPGGQVCQNQSCCAIDCSGMECGASCGKLCASCHAGKVCDAAHHCVAGACVQNGLSCATQPCCEGLTCNSSKICMSCGKLDDDCNATYGCCGGLACVASGGVNKKCWYSGCIYGCDPNVEMCIPGGCAVQ